MGAARYRLPNPKSSAAARRECAVLRPALRACVRETPFQRSRNSRRTAERLVFKAVSFRRMTDSVQESMVR